MFSCVKTTVRDSSVRNGSIALPQHLARIGDSAGDRRHGGGQRAGEEGPTAGSLPSLEVSIGGAHRVLARLEAVAVHRNAHRAPRLAPFGTRVSKYPVQTLDLGLAFDLLGTGDDERANPARQLAPAHH